MVFGGILEESLYDNKVNLWHLILGLVLWGIVIYVFEPLIPKLRFARRWFRGDTNILISNGSINVKCLKHNRLEIDQIVPIAREKNIFDLSEIKNMYIESDGSFTIEPFIYQHLLLENKFPIYTLIENEVINKEHLKQINKSEVWLYNQLDKRNINKVEVVFYADSSEYRGI